MSNGCFFAERRPQSSRFYPTSAEEHIMTSRQSAGLSTATHFETSNLRWRSLAASLAVFAMTSLASAETVIAPVPLGFAGSYALLSKAGITTTGNTAILGHIGVSPIAGTAITGFSLILD